MTLAALPHRADDRIPTTRAGAPRRRRRVTAALAATIATVGAVLAVPTQASAYSPPAVRARTAAETTILRAVFNEINAERAVYRLPALRLNSQLMLSARRHDLMMARAQSLSHQLPGEPYFSTRITQAGYSWHWAGENIAWTSLTTVAGAISLERVMYNEKAPNNGHRLNILNRNYKDVGVDVYGDGLHHRMWLTMDFGSH